MFKSVTAHYSDDLIVWMPSSPSLMVLWSKGPLVRGLVVRGHAGPMVRGPTVQESNTNWGSNGLMALELESLWAH